MFRPRTSPIAREEFLETDEDLVIADETAQAVRGGALRLMPTTLPPQPHEFSWPVVMWGQEDELRPFNGEIDGKWVSLFNSIPVTTPQEFPFDEEFLDVDTDVGDYLYLRQKTGDPAGQDHWPANVDNAVGWTLQMRLQVLEEDDEDGRHRIVLDDGTRREVLRLHRGGIAFELNPSLSIAADMTRPRELRIGAKQDDIYVLLDHGQGVAGIDGYTGISIAKELAFGQPSADTARHRTLFDYIHQFHDGVWVDERPSVERTYSTDAEAAITTAYAPKRRVKSFDQLVIEASGDTLGGDTNVITEYRSSETGDLWVLLGTTLITTIPIQRVSLAGIDVAGDGTDQVRFRITQESADGSAEPPRVETLTVLTTFVTESFAIVPRWGPTVGGSSHLLRLLATAQTALLGPGPLTNLDFHAPYDEDYNDTIDSLEGTPSGDTEFVEAGYGASARLGSVTQIADPFTEVLDSFPEYAPYGMLGSGLSPVWVGGTLVLMQAAISMLEDGEIVERTAQRVTADAGNGVKVASYTSPGAVRFLLQIMEGAVEVVFNGVTRVFDVHDCWTPRVIAIDLTGTSDLEIKAVDAPATFTFAPVEAYTVAAGSVTYDPLPAPTSGVGADLFFTPSLYQSAVLASTKNGLDGWEIGLAADGRPYAWIGDGAAEISIDSMKPLTIDQRHNVAFTHRVWPDHTGLQLLVDGQIVAEAITEIAEVSSGTGLTVGGVPGVYDQVRVHSGSLDAMEFAVANGLANPSFQTAYSVPLDSDNKLILRFGQVTGPFVDDSGRDHHAHLLHEWQAGLRRDQRFQGRPATLFLFNGAIGILHTPDFIQDTPFGIFARGFFRPSTAVQELASKWNAGETIGWKIEILTDYTVKVTTKDGVNTRELTTTAVLGDDDDHAVHVQIESTGITVRIDEDEETLVASVGSLAAATEDMVIGRGLVAYLGEFVFRKALLSQEDFLSWADETEAKWTPTDDQVLVDGEAVPNDQVLHYSPDRKYVNFPAHAKGNVPVLIQTQGVTLDADRPFIYALTYERPIQ
jgi:hypothetical protein